MEEYKQEIKYPTETTYWIAYTNSLIFGYGECTQEQQMTTGQPFLFQTTDKEQWIEKLKNDFNTEIENGIK
jgi:hypothetical protein